MRKIKTQAQASLINSIIFLITGVLMIAILCMLSNSVTKCVQILFSRSTVFGESKAFVALSYFIAAVLSLILCFIFKKKDEPKIEWDI